MRIQPIKELMTFLLEQNKTDLSVEPSSVYKSTRRSNGDCGSTLDKVLSYKFFIDTNPSDLTMALGSTQPLAQMSTRIISWG
jgi:hypothetical protein